MAANPASMPQEVVNRLTTKLQVFIDGLADDEARAMGMILQQATTDGDVTGYAVNASQLRLSSLNTRGIIIVGGLGDLRGNPGVLGVEHGIIIVGGRL